MKLIVGLGNPGTIYRDSRHNIGFLTVKALAGSSKAAFKRDIGTRSLSAKIKYGKQNIILAMPLTFMNLSGPAVKALLKKYKAGLEDLLVVCDDLDLEFGRLKIKSGGTSAGHRGVQSVIEALAGDSFSRLRVGIGRPGARQEASEYVLSPFTRQEKESLAGIIGQAGQCCKVWLEQGTTEAMNTYNRRSEAK